MEWDLPEADETFSSTFGIYARTANNKTNTDKTITGRINATAFPKSPENIGKKTPIAKKTTIRIVAKIKYFSNLPISSPVKAFMIYGGNTDQDRKYGKVVGWKQTDKVFD